MADRLLCVGASHALGGTASALDARAKVVPGGPGCCSETATGKQRPRVTYARKHENLHSPHTSLLEHSTSHRAAS
jgi:hypothetical protein